jgi:hypothetical protein
VIEIEEVVGLGITERAEQAKLMGLSLPQLDRVRRAARDAPTARSTTPRPEPVRATSSARAAAGRVTGGGRRARPGRAARRVQLGVRVPAVLLERLRGHSERTGWSLAVLTAVAIDDWLNRRGCSGPSGLDQRVVTAVNL